MNRVLGIALALASMGFVGSIEAKTSDVSPRTASSLRVQHHNGSAIVMAGAMTDATTVVSTQ